MKKLINVESLKINKYKNGWMFVIRKIKMLGNNSMNMEVDV